MKTSKTLLMLAALFMGLHLTAQITLPDPFASNPFASLSEREDERIDFKTAGKHKHDAEKFGGYGHG